MPTTPKEEHTTSPEQIGTPAETFPFQEHHWTVQQLHHLTRDVGKLQEAVDTIKTTLADQAKTLNWVRYTMFVAIGALAVVAYLGDKAVDRVIEALAK